MRKKLSTSTKRSLEQINNIFDNKLIQKGATLYSRWQYGKLQTVITVGKTIQVAQISHIVSPHSTPKSKGELLEFKNVEELEQWLNKSR